MKKLESSMQLTTALKQVTDGQLVPAPTLRCPAGYGAPAPPGEHATAPSQSHLFLHGRHFLLGTAAVFLGQSSSRSGTARTLCRPASLIPPH